MTYYQSSRHHLHALWSNFHGLGRPVSANPPMLLRRLHTHLRRHPIAVSRRSNLCTSSGDGRSLLECVPTDSARLRQDFANIDSANNRMMLVDGHSILYRSYYKLLSKLQHGHLEHADGNGDWVLTIFRAVSFLLDTLEFTPSHVVVVFDHDGMAYISLNFFIWSSIWSICSYALKRI